VGRDRHMFAHCLRSCGEAVVGGAIPNTIPSGFLTEAHSTDSSSYNVTPHGPPSKLVGPPKPQHGVARLIGTRLS
jgi:hypothetical protein